MRKNKSANNDNYTFFPRHIDRLYSGCYAGYEDPVDYIDMFHGRRRVLKGCVIA